MRVERAILAASLALLTGAGTRVAGVGPVSEQVRIAQNEAAAIADLRDIVAASQLYKTSNGTLPSSLRCLGSPIQCGFPAGAPPFLDELRGAVPGMEGVLAPYSFVSRGYLFHYEYGLPTADGLYDPGLLTFTINANPLVPEASGVRYFGADHTGTICAMVGVAFPNDGIALPVGCAGP